MATAAQNAASRARRSASFQTRLDWYGEQVRAGVVFTAEQRLRFAVEYLKDKVKFNISRPVTKTSINGRTVVTNRSVRGEFPKADTTRLMKDIFAKRTGTLTWMVGSTLDYAIYLELVMDRSFLLRTLNEERVRLGWIMRGAR